MSGWGLAKDKTNVLVIECDTWAQAIAIKRAAQDRREMRRIQICWTPPKERRGVLHSRKHFSEFAGPWLDYYRAESEAA